MDPRRPEAEVVIVEGDRIAAVGERALLEAFPGAAREDLRGRSCLPGFIDAHNHLCIAALHPVWADLSRVDSPEALERALRGQAAREPEAGWIRGFGWNETRTGYSPTRAELDALDLGRPVLLAHYSLHQGVVDSRGLDELGIGRGTPDPVGGAIARGPDGAPAGLLVERAFGLAHARSLAATRDPERWADLVAARARTLLSDGVTCVHDAACPPEAEALYRRMAAAGTLPLSVLTLPHPEAILMPPEALRLEGPRTGEGDERVRVGPIKVFADGGVAPALDVRLGGRRLQLGMRFADLADAVERAQRHGFRVAVHAIGNAGVEAALEAFERAARASPGADPRFRIEHASLVTPRQIRRMRELGAVAVVQPGFLFHMGQAVEKVPFEDATWMAFGDMERAGVPLAASSDDPCAFHEPLRTSAHGATRITGSGAVLDPQQSVDYLSWLRAWTAGAAFAGGQEGERGRLLPGLRADLVLLEGALDPEHPPRVSETWVAGACAWRAPGPWPCQ